MRGKPILLSERRRIKQLIEEGYSFGDIAKIIARHKSTVVKEIARGGGKENYDPDASFKLSLPATVSEKRWDLWQKRNPISEEEGQKILKLDAEGLSSRSIGAALGKSHHRIRLFLLKNRIAKEVGKDTSLADKVDALQQQIEIIFSILENK